MFVSRTVAAEVLMEAEINDTGYAVLKALDREGALRFSLSYVLCLLLYDMTESRCHSSLVEDLVKVVTSRTIYPGHHSDNFRSTVIHQDLLNHSGFNKIITSLPMEGFSKPQPYRSPCHASNGFHRQYHSGYFTLGSRTSEPDTRLR
jgi:hypothetical protein